MSRVASARPHPLRGILMIMTAVALFTVMDSMAKYLSRFYPVPGIVWARYAFHLLFVVMILGPRMKLGLVRTRHLGLQIVRGMLLAASSMLFFSALKFMPMAEASSISFVAPMLVTLLGVFLLKEKVEPARWVAVVAGFVGVLIIIRPGSGIFSWVAVLPLRQLLMPGDVYAARHDYRDADQRPVIGKVAEHQVTHQDHPDQLRIGERRQGRDRRLVVGADQDQMAQSADEADRRQHQRVRQGRRHGPLERQHRRQH